MTPDIDEQKITIWQKISDFFRKALPYQTTEYFEVSDSSFVTVYTKWFGFILAYSVFHVYNTTTIVSGHVTVGSVEPQDAPIQIDEVEQLLDEDLSGKKLIQE